MLAALAMMVRASHSPLLSLTLALSLAASSLGAGCSPEDEETSTTVTVVKAKGGSGGSEAGGQGGGGGVAGKGSGGQGGGAQAGQGGSITAGSGGSAQAGSGGSAQSGSGGSAQAGSGGAVAGQGGSSAGGSSAGQGSGGQAPATSLSFVAPSEGQVLQQTGDPPQVQIHFEVQASADIAKVEYRIENGELMATKTSAPGFAHDHVFKIAGDRWVEARGFGADGAQLATTKVNFAVKAPSLGGCLDELTALGVKFTTTKAKGVVDAVKLQGPLNGVIFANGLKDEMTGDPIACQFVKTLWEFAAVLKPRGFVKVGTLGSYCYRCCCAWSETNYCRGPDDPEPDCSANGYSTHSWGRAVDVRYLIKADGTTYDVNNPSHFVITSGGTCGTALSKQNGISKEMYEVACEAHQKKIFSTILTPNHNAAHRNHYHMDTGQSGPATGATVKVIGPSFDALIDSGDHPDDCGGAELSPLRETRSRLARKAPVYPRRPS